MRDSDRSISFVRTADAPTLPPPPGQVGVAGWLWRNMFSSMANFSNPAAGLQSIGMIVLTVVVFYLGFTGIYMLADFAVVQAIWSDPQGLERLACATVNQGGELPAEWYGACWPFIQAKWKLITYGRFPEEELWRVNLVFLGLAFGITWLSRASVPARRMTGVACIALAGVIAVVYATAIGAAPQERVGVWLFIVIGGVLLAAPDSGGEKIVGGFMLLVFPVIAFVLLTGGHLDVSVFAKLSLLAATAVLLGLSYAARKGMLGDVGDAFGGVFAALGVVLAYFAVAMFFASIDFGLYEVPTADWGGLLVTLVVAITGIVASLPLGILLALGRRSSLPAIRLLCTIFIEFWRGVPLITVLFMSSVMLPLFLPEGTEFDKLLRALIGVALFSAAYMAEVVRGGLQAIPRGQYEGAMAIGLPYWRMMSLIVLPQALTVVIPGIVNNFIGLFKDTTLVLIIGLFDLLGSVQTSFTDAAWSTPVQSMTGYVTAALIFWFFCFGMSRYSMHMERKLRRGHER